MGSGSVGAIGNGRSSAPSCCGNPNIPHAILNDCAAEPRWIVIGAEVIPETFELITVVLGACDQHVFGVRAHVRQRTYELAELFTGSVTEDDEPQVYGIDALDALVEALDGDVWVMQSARSA